MEQDIIGEVVYNQIYKFYDNTFDAMEEIYRDMIHQDFLRAVYEMSQMNQSR